MKIDLISTYSNHSLLASIRYMIVHNPKCVATLHDGDITCESEGDDKETMNQLEHPQRRIEDIHAVRLAKTDAPWTRLPISKIKLPCAAWHKSRKMQNFRHCQVTWAQAALFRSKSATIPLSHVGYHHYNIYMLRTTEMRIPNAFASDDMFEK